MKKICLNNNVCPFSNVKYFQLKTTFFFNDNTSFVKQLFFEGKLLLSVVPLGPVAA